MADGEVVGNHMRPPSIPSAILQGGWQYRENEDERLAEDYSWIFYSVDESERLQYVNLAWRDFADRNGGDHLSELRLGRPLFDGWDPKDAEFYRQVCEGVRRQDCPYWEDLIPCHSNNQSRWMLMRIQRYGDDLVFSCYFLKSYGTFMPRVARIKCLFTGQEYGIQWQESGIPADEETTWGLCPDCSLQLYARAREIGK
jgi:hypothetical protein